MAEKLDPKQVVTFEELLRSMMYEQEALRRVLVRKGLLTNEEMLEHYNELRKLERAWKMSIKNYLDICIAMFQIERKLNPGRKMSPCPLTDEGMPPELVFARHQHCKGVKAESK